MAGLFNRDQLSASPSRIVELFYFCGGEGAIVDADVVYHAIEETSWARVVACSNVERIS
jgi:hypothetical protein